MSPNNDRQFRALPEFLRTAFGNIADRTLRIFDIETLGDYQSVNMHMFGPDHDAELSSDMTIGVWNGHMGLLIPSAENIPGDWINWRPNVSAASNYGRNDWCAELNAGPTLPTAFSLRPWRICHRDVRLPQRNVRNPIGGSSWACSWYSACLQDGYPTIRLSLLGVFERLGAQWPAHVAFWC